MTNETMSLIEKLLQKSADVMTTARLGFAEGRLGLDDVVRSLDAVGEGISRLTMIAEATRKGETSLSFSTLESVETSHVEEDFETTLREVIDRMNMA